MAQDILFVYSSLIDKTWNRMVQLVGVHTVMILTKRALWLTSRKYSEADFIRYNEEGVFLAELAEGCEPELIKVVLEEFLSSLIDILTRLVGQDITRKLAEELDVLLLGEGIK